MALTNEQIERRLEQLESQVAVILGTKGAPSAPAAEPVQRPKATSVSQAQQYAKDGYTYDGNQGRSRGTHVGNLDEAIAEVGLGAKSVADIYVLSGLLPTTADRAATGLPPAWWAVNADEAENYGKDLNAWWAEIERRRKESAGTHGGPSGGPTDGDRP